jgi:hypothetical protein
LSKVLLIATDASTSAHNEMHCVSMSMGRSVADKTKDVPANYLRNLECEVNQALTKERPPQQCSETDWEATLAR